MFAAEDKSPAKANRATWDDVLRAAGAPPYPIDGYLTRDELVEELTARGVDVDVGSLVWWEKSGTLPRPVRRWRDGAPRALYPGYAIDAVKTLRSMQAKGRTLEEIRPIMQAWALYPTQGHDPFAEPLTRLRTVLLDLARVLQRDAVGIRVQLLDGAGEPFWVHELPIPSELTTTSTSTPD